MTAGTDPDPAESSHAVKMPSIMQISHIPYLDHNYGQPPPMTPPDSNSPAPDDVDTGNEEEERNAVTRCICGFDHDDGYMICCDKCSVWQHIECMGISSESLPETYLCEQCEPRTLDRDRAKGIQAKKKEEMSDDDDDDNDESAEEADGTTYTAFSNTPTRITLTAKVSHQRRKTTGPKVKGDNDKKTKRRKIIQRQKPRMPIEFLPVDEETNGPWESNCNKIDYYQETSECTYSQALEEFAANIAQMNQVRCMPDGIEQHCKVVEVQRNTKGLVATEDLYKDQFLIKFKGKMMLGSEFDEENQMFRRYNPYVLFYYHNPDCPKLCVDARILGNEARFIRRSCSPNAEVRHVFQSGKLYLAVFSQNPLPKGAEITIPFEFAFADYHCSLSCACAQDTCAVAKYKLKCQVSAQELNSIPEQNGHRLCDDSSNSSHNPLNASPLRAALSTQNSCQGDSDSDLDNNPDRSADGESRRKKLSREERKLEAYVKQIEKMEKKEKKRQQPQKDHRQVIRLSSDEGGKLHIKGMRCPKRLIHKRRSNGTPACGLKKKRARVSSCSSEPLSPDEVSSSASTPTTPKPVSTILEEPPLIETPSTSPSRNFQFPKAKLDENSQDAVITSALSSPTSPCSPRESEPETKRTLSTASSNSDITMEIEMEESDVGHEELCEVSMDQTRDIGTDLSVRLAEITSECNSPSPCPSSSASPTSSESVMNGCPYTTASGGRSPGPAPGSPLAALLHGVRSTQSTPLYCSLKKRWLYKFLNSQNGVGVSVRTPVNGVRTLTFVEQPKVAPLNHKTPTTTIYKEPLPLKKRYLRAAANSSWTRKTDAINNVVNQSVKPESQLTIVVSNIDGGTRLSETLPNHTVSTIEKIINPELEKQVSGSPTTSVNVDSKTTRTPELPLSETSTLSRGHDMIIPDDTIPTVDCTRQGLLSQGTLDIVLDIKPVIISTVLVQRSSDPRQQSPSSSQLSITSSTSTQPQPLTSVIQSPVSTVTQSCDVSSGTPGKKKVSLLEYRNRSLQRLSGDGPKPSSSHTSQISSASSTSNTPTPSIASTSVITTLGKPSTSNVSPSNHPAPVKKSDSTGSNGPSIEPVSPEEDERLPSSRLKMGKPTNSPFETKLNTLVKMEAGMSLYNRKLSALISEQLLSNPVHSPSSSKSPSTASNSPSIPPPPPPPPDTAGKGDAMEIEEEDGQTDQKIFVTTPLVSPSRPPVQAPTQPTLIADYGRPHHQHQIPDYRLHDRQPHVQSSILTPVIQQPSSSQLPSPMSVQAPQLAPHISQSPYLVTTASQPIPSQIRFPASYQNPSVQSAPYYQQ